VKGKIEVDAFRLINPSNIIFDPEPRQITSNIHEKKQTLDGYVKGLGTYYYSLIIKF
jgi:26S proteasome regulatory subunit N11